MSIRTAFLTLTDREAGVERVRQLSNRPQPNEGGADQVESLLAEAWLARVTVHASFVSLAELEYIRTQEQGPQSAAELIAWVKKQPVQWHHSDDALCSAAAKLRAAHRISFADSFVAALAQRLDASLVHKDPELDPLARGESWDDIADAWGGKVAKEAISKTIRLAREALLDDPGSFARSRDRRAAA